MSYRSKRTKPNGDQAVQSNIAPSTLSKSKRPRCLPSNLDPTTIPTERVCTTTSKDKAVHMGERSQPQVSHKFTFPPHLDPSFVRLSQRSKPPTLSNANVEKRSQPIEVPHKVTQPSQPEAIPELHRVEAQDLDPHMQENVAEYHDSDSEPLQQDNLQDNVRKSKSSYARSMKSRSVTPNWPNDINIDDKEDVLTIDAERNYKILSGSIQPRDIDNLEKGVKCIVHFNEFNQPVRKSGCVLVKYLGSLAKTEKFCPIGAETWPHLNKMYKADIVERVREKFVIPNGEVFDNAILMRVAKCWRHYKHEFKKKRFHPDKKTKEQIINDVPHGHTKDNWMRLVELWYTQKSKKLSDIGKEARASQSHVHTTGSVSYANKRADFVESNGKQPSHLEFFQLTHTKIGGGFVENTSSSQLLEEANSKVDEVVRNSSPSKSRAEIENDVFDKLMYETDNPKRPVGFGFGVKQSQVFGVHGILRKGGYRSKTTTNNSAEMELMKAKMLEMEKENQELRSKVDQSNARVNQSNARVDQSNQILLQALNAIRSGKVTDEFFEEAQLALRVPTSQVGSAASDNSDRNGLDHHHASGSPN